MAKGSREYEKFLRGEHLSARQAILAQCFVCNGKEEGGTDCQGSKSCPLYSFMPYKRGAKTRKSREYTPEQKKIMGDRLIAARANKKKGE